MYHQRFREGQDIFPRILEEPFKKGRIVEGDVTPICSGLFHVFRRPLVWELANWYMNQTFTFPRNWTNNQALYCSHFHWKSVALLVENRIRIHLQKATPDGNIYTVTVRTLHSDQKSCHFCGAHRLRNCSDISESRVPARPNQWSPLRFACYC